jgi:predicted metal-binding membrane protein
MVPFSTRVLRVERYLTPAGLLILTAVAWVLLYWQSGMMDSQAMGLTMGMSALLFLAIWVVMMVAMMFPASVPLVLAFNKVHASKHPQDHPLVPAWIFIGSYLLLWSLCGIIAYLLAAGSDQLAAHFMWLTDNGARLGGGILLLAGLYQFSPIKYVCLGQCCHPSQFVEDSWRDGYGGAFRMGLMHGRYCLGCCWFLFVILFPLGIMNLVVMALITVLIFAEKVLPGGRLLSKLAGAGLTAYGLLIIFMPAILSRGGM